MLSPYLRFINGCTKMPERRFWDYKGLSVPLTGGLENLFQGLNLKMRENPAGKRKLTGELKEEIKHANKIHR